MNPKENNSGNFDIQATKAGTFILLKLPKNAKDILFIKTLGHPRWDSFAFCWVIKEYPGTVDKLNMYFSNRIQWMEEPVRHRTGEIKSIPLEKNTLIIEKYLDTPTY